MTSAARCPAPDDLQRFLSLLWRDGVVREIRIPKHNQYGQTASGYFDNVEAAARAAEKWDSRANIYLSLNPVSPALLARAVNRIDPRAVHATSDDDIVEREWLFIDVDPRRPSGISSTDEELIAARGLLERLTAYLSTSGWPEPVTCMSGNGYYALYGIELPNDAEATALVKKVLESLADRFDTETAHVDTGVYNAARIMALVGTMKEKGDSTQDRPHRRSYVLSGPAHIGVVSRAQLEAVAALSEARRPALLVVPRSSGRLTDMLDAAGIEYREQPPDARGVTWYHVRRCPLHDDGRPFECGVGQTLPDGPYAGHCFHPEGEDKGWHAFKRALGLDGGAWDGHDPAIASGDRAPEDGSDFARTDAGNGELFARLYGDRVRYDHRRKHWLVWQGHAWDDDRDGEVRRLAKLAARHRYISAPGIDDLSARSATAKFAIQSENRQRLDAMLAQAQAEPPISDAGDRWNRHSWLIGVANGALDLRTGTLRPGRPADGITMRIPAAFDATASCPRWLRFLEEVFRGDRELIDFIQRAAGYSLTGITSEQCMFLCYGKGANGKSVLLAVLRAIAGGYAYNAPFSLFEIHGRSAIPNDLAALVGRRLVTSSETNEGTRLNEARVKALTGCDPVTARFLHGEFFTFDPVAKYWLAVNHKPTVADDSHGFWRRVRLIPFLRQFGDGEADQHLVEVLLAELSGILRWAVAGALAWQESGLGMPPAVRQATETYRVESDPLAAFIDQCCFECDGLTVPSSRAYKAYRAWALEQGMSDREMLTSTMFGSRMSAKFEKRHTNRGNAYDGIGLLSDQPDRDQVKGSVKGFESDDASDAVFPPENSLSRKNIEEPFTTLHPVTEQTRQSQMPESGT